MSERLEKIAIIHNWFWNYRGAERVLSALCKIYPTADLYFLFGDEEKIRHTYRGHTIRFSFLQRLPGIKRYYKLAGPFWPIATESLDLSEYDIVISSSASTVWGVITPIDTVHVAYVYSPMRYLWDQRELYSTKMSFFSRPFFNFFSHLLRIWDLGASKRPDSVAVISQFVADRMYRYYRRKPDMIIYPPLIDLEELFDHNDTSREEHLIVVSGFEENKGVEHAIEYAVRSGKLLILTGDSNNAKKLKKKYADSENLKFTGWVSRDRLIKLISSAKATLFLGEEDLGLVPLESIALGTPVVALASGGAVETIEDGVNGVLLSDVRQDSITKAIERCEGFRIERKSERIKMQKFDFKDFKTNIEQLIQNGRTSKTRKTS